MSLQILYLNDNRITVIEEGTFDSLFSVKIIALHNNRLRTISAALFIYGPRPLQLPMRAQSLRLGLFSDTNQWDCSSLCWLKHEEQHSTVDFPMGNPICVTGGAWNSLQCDDPGMFVKIIQIFQPAHTKNNSPTF